MFKQVKRIPVLVATLIFFVLSLGGCVVVTEDKVRYRFNAEFTDLLKIETEIDKGQDK